MKCANIIFDQKARNFIEFPRQAFAGLLYNTATIAQSHDGYPYAQPQPAHTCSVHENKSL